MNLTFAFLFPILTAAGILCFFAYYVHCMVPRKGTLEWIAQAQVESPRRFTFSNRLHPMEKKDALPLLLLTVVYAVSAFWNLGDTTAPQSFQSFDGTSTITFSLDREVALTGLDWYAGIGTGNYSLEVSADGEHWQALRVVDEVSEDYGATWQEKRSGQDTTGLQTRTAYYWVNVAEGAAPGSIISLRQDYVSLFKWACVTPQDGGIAQARYFRLTGMPNRAPRSPVELGELALYDEYGTRISGNWDGAEALFDEQSTIPEASHWTNSTYFDEIYHARTALEHNRGIYPYENSHPPLGKLIIGLGIRLFGMTPFGWRFMGTLCGVLMVPLLYWFLKNLFGKTVIALCGTALFTFDFMHLVQTRIATIDSYGVFFILAMFFFLYRFLALPAGTPFYKCALPLFLSGLMFGIGAASKWIVIYGGVGLAELYFIGLFWKCRDWPGPGEGAPRRWAWMVKTLLFSVLCFVAVPAVIYMASYIPMARAAGATDLQGLWKTVWDNQVFMFTYHRGVHDPHPYSSRWYQWLVDARPILYYMVNETGFTTRFASFNNPLVSWAGLTALITVGVQTVRRRCGKGLFILIACLNQFIPWLIIGRITFAYHYFPTILFLCVALAYVMNDLVESGRRWKPAVYGLTGGAAGLYALFYPALIGLRVPTWFMRTFIRWFPSWPF